MRNLALTKGLSVTSSLLIALGAAGCLSHKDEAPMTSIAPAAGGSGAFGVVTVNGRQKMYLPLPSGSSSSGATNAQIAVIDVGVAGAGVAGAPALMKLIDLGSPDVATATGADPQVVVAASTDNTKVRFIDPVTDTLVASIDLDATFGRSNFSGGGGYVTGVAIDPASHRAILSTWNGFTLVDTQAHAVIKTIEAPPSENFGFDSIHQRLVAPFYDCASSSSSAGKLSLCDRFKGPNGSPMTDGLNVIDLTDGTVYTYADPTAGAAADASTTAALTPTAPVGTEPDSAAIDPTIQVAVIPAEGGGFQNVLDLSKATFDKQAGTFTAPNHPITGVGLTGVAIEPVHHLGFWEEEHSSEVGVADVAAANGGAAHYVQAYMPPLPGGAAWANMGDPHGIAVTTGIAGGLAVGFVVSQDQRWVARVDLQKALDLGADAGALLDLTPAVTYLDATTAIPPSH